MLAGAASAVCFSLEGGFFSSKRMLGGFFCEGCESLAADAGASFGDCSGTFFFGIFALACSSFRCRRFAFLAAFSTAGSANSSLVNFSFGARFAMVHHTPVQQRGRYPASLSISRTTALP